MKIIYSICLLIAAISCSTNKDTNKIIPTYCSEEIINTINSKFDLDLDTINLCDFVLNGGIPYKLDTQNRSECERPNLDFLLIDYIELNGKTFPHKNCNILIILESKKEQSKKYKSVMLNELRHEYKSYKGTPNDYRCPSCKIITINGQSDFPYKIRERLYKLKPKDIVYIKVYDKQMNSALYGTQGKANGIIEIQTK